MAICLKAGRDRVSRSVKGIRVKVAVKKAVKCSRKCREGREADT